jgi:hypothetical protein
MRTNTVAYVLLVVSTIIALLLSLSVTVSNTALFDQHYAHCC